MSKPYFPHLAPYRGREPFLYLIFHQDDRDRVRPLLHRLYRRGCRVWYTLDYSGGGRRARVRDERMKHAAFIAVFLSPSALADDDISAAILLCQTQACPSLLMVTPGLPADWELLAARKFTTEVIDIGYQDSPRDIEAELISSKGFSQDLLGKPVYFLVRAFKRFALAAVVLAGVFISGTFAYRPSRPGDGAEAQAVPDAVVFSDTAVLRAAQQELKMSATQALTRLDLEDIDTLRLDAAPASLDDLALMPSLRRLEIPQSLVPLAAKLPADRAYTIVVYGEEDN